MSRPALGPDAPNRCDFGSRGRGEPGRLVARGGSYRTVETRDRESRDLCSRSRSTSRAQPRGAGRDQHPRTPPPIEEPWACHTPPTWPTGPPWPGIEAPRRSPPSTSRTQPRGVGRDRHRGAQRTRGGPTLPWPASTPTPRRVSTTGSSRLSRGRAPRLFLRPRRQAPAPDEDQRRDVPSVRRPSPTAQRSAPSTTAG